MSFNCVDYLYLAQELLEQALSGTQPSDEAKLRSSISRAYYAAFHKTRDYINNHTNTRVPRDGSAHVTVRDFFKGDIDGKKDKISRFLDYLLKNRTKADYDSNVPGLAPLAQTALIRAKEVIELVNELEERELN